MMPFSTVPPLACLAAAAAALIAATPVHAISITAQREHNPQAACAAVQQVLADVSARRDWITPFFSTEALGFVEYGEHAAFLDAMTSSEGKADQRPLRLARLYRVTKDKFSPLYLAAIDRLAWHEYREEDDGNGGSERIHDPRHYGESSYWLVSFQSDRVIRMREAFEVYQLADEDRRVARCGD